MRLLIVSYYFPPAAGGGVQRVLKWAKYLPEFGVEVDVLAPADPRWLDSGGGLVAPPDTTVHRTGNLSPRSVNPRNEIEARSGARRLVRRLALQPRRLLVPDVRIGWAPSAIRTGKRVLDQRSIDVLLSTSPPETGHVVGRALQRHARIPWVADFRDSWLDNPTLDRGKRLVRAKLALNARIAARTAGRADRMVTVSEPLAADLRRRFPDVPVSVITNGIDFDDLRDLPGIDQRPDRFTISYTGNFFGPWRATSFLRAIESILGEDPSLADVLDVQFVGGMKQADRDLIASSPLLDRVVTLREFAPYREVLALQRASDLLFLFIAPGPGTSGVFSGKVFEYVASRRPILALVPEGNVAGQLVSEAGTGVVVPPDDVAAIGRELLSQVRRWQQQGRAPDADLPTPVHDRISRREQARVLASLLHGLTAAAR